MIDVTEIKTLCPGVCVEETHDGRVSWVTRFEPGCGVIREIGDQFASDGSDVIVLSECMQSPIDMFVKMQDVLLQADDGGNVPAMIIEVASDVLVDSIAFNDVLDDLADSGCKICIAQRPW